MQPKMTPEQQDNWENDVSPLRDRPGYMSTVMLGLFRYCASSAMTPEEAFPSEHAAEDRKAYAEYLKNPT